MAEEDLIFGKNRHLFGGIEPSNMLIFTAERDNTYVKLTVELPKDTIIDGQTLCTVKGAVIRRKSTDYPENEFDGDLVADISESGSIIDSNTSVNKDYYYTAFPYTTQGVYNRNKANRASVSKGYLFGYDLTISTSNPSGRVTYPSGVDNAKYTAAKMTFGGSFNYGSWNFKPGTKFMPRPCMLNYNGTVDHYLDPDDYTKKTDGTASSVADGSFDGNAMMEWPKIYTKRWESNGVYHFRCSDIKQDSTWECWCNYDRNNNQIDHFYTSIYNGSTKSNVLRSISGAAVDYTHANNFINRAKGNGNDWYIDVLSDRLLINDLLVMMAKSTNCQLAYGYGRISKTSSSSSEHLTPGSMDTKGMFWGSNSYTDGIKVFGMEHWWGNYWRFIAGWSRIAGGVQLVKVTRGTYDGSEATDYNTNGSGYISISGSAPSGTSGGYINSMKTESYGRIPISASGSSSTYEGDGLYFSSLVVPYAAVGGTQESGFIAGPFATTLNVEADNTNSNYNATLSCKPSAV